MERAWSYLERLSRYPHRGVGTPEERAAAQESAQWLEAMGYEVEVQPFRAPRDTLYLGPSAVMAGLLAAAALGLLLQPWAGLALCLLLLIPLVGEMLGKGWDLDWYLPKVTSQNVIARGKERRDASRTLVFTCHLDTQHATPFFHPRFVPHLVRYMNLAYGSIGLMPLALGLHWAFPEAAWSAWLVVGAGLLLMAHLSFLLTCALTGRFINGANDNGTGSALVLALAERFARDPLPGVRMHFVLTGAEEVGTRGMKRFMRQASYDKESTYFINLDNLGGGDLHYLLGEGMTYYHPYSTHLVQVAEATATRFPGRVRSRRNLLLPTDGMIPAAAGYQTISFLAFLPDGRLPHYHWYTDTLENVDPELLAFTERFLVDYVHRLAGVPASV